MQGQDRDLYEVLGLDADATSDEIKAAYRRLAKKREGRERDERTREQVRREQQAREEAERRRREQEERERRQARAEQQERQRREQEHEDEETLRKHGKQFWLMGMPLLLLFFIAYDDEETDLEARMVVWIGVAVFGLTVWLIQFVAKALRNGEPRASWPPNTCRVTYCEGWHPETSESHSRRQST